MTKRFRFRHIQKEGKDFLELSNDLAALNKAYAELFVQRYKDDPRGDFKTEMDARAKRIGLIGQRMFQSLLNQYRIPYIHDEPAFKFQEDRLVSDFMIPGFGSIEVKTRPFYTKPGLKTDMIIVNQKLWDNCVEHQHIPNFVICLRLNEAETTAEVMGYAHGSEVVSWPNCPGICVYEPGYCKDYKELRHFSRILTKLKALGIKETFE